VQEQVDAGLLTPEQARTHPYSNVITRCVGANEDVAPDVYFGNLETGNSVSFPSDCQWTDRPDWTRWSYSFDTYSGTLAGTPNAPNDDDFADANTHEADVPKSFGPAIPAWLV